jgi:hypothetical protein
MTPAQRKARREAARNAYHANKNDPEYRARRLARALKYRLAHKDNPEFRARRLASVLKYQQADIERRRAADRKSYLAQAADPVWREQRRKASLEYRRGHKDDQEYREQVRARNRRWERAHPEHVAATKRKRRSNYDAETYNRMVAEQGGKCFLCGGVNTDGKALHADHCHITGIPRRPLCSNCNLGLGAAADMPWILKMPGRRILALFRHDRELISRAIDYLNHFAEVARWAAAVPILCGVPLSGEKPGGISVLYA